MALSNFLAVLFCHLLLSRGGVMAAAALAAARPIAAAAAKNARRIFVGGISPSCTSLQLRSAFEKHGRIDSVTVHNTDEGKESDACKARQQQKQQRPFAFVTFETPDSARRALLATVPPAPATAGDALYGNVRPALSPQARDRSNARRDRTDARRGEILRLAPRTNLVLQVNKSHLDRLSDYLESNSFRDGGIGSFGSVVKVLGSVDTTTSRNVRLLLLSAADRGRLVGELTATEYLKPALNKYYAVEADSLFAVGDAAELSAEIVAMLNEPNKGNGNSKQMMRIRVQTFPSSLQLAVANAIDEACPNATPDPVDFTHLLSVVRVLLEPKGERDEMYVMGLSDASMFGGNLNERRRPGDRDMHDGSLNEDVGNDEDEVSRAYYKLQEGFDRYPFDDDEGIDFTQSVALDVGAAPGGWSKYLKERGCRKVFAVDPAALSPSVLFQEGVTHLRMKVEDALPVLQVSNEVVDLYVSDMCLSEMERQLDLMLLAKDAGVLRKGAFFVLTMKCVVGHSKATFDGQVSYAVDRLLQNDIARGVETMHLFNNRNGERTVMGYLK